MVDGVGIDAGVRNFPEHAHILAGVGRNQHRDEGMKKHALCQQRRFNCAGGDLLVLSGKFHFTDQGQRNRALV
jgi:hypothetical protein